MHRRRASMKSPRFPAHLATTTSQLITNVTNTSIAFVVAATSSRSVFEGFAYFYVAYSLVTVACRALVGEGILLHGCHRSGRRVLEFRRVALMGFGSGLLIVPLVAIGAVDRVLLFAPLLFPAALVQETARLVAFKEANGRVALRSDLTWLVIQTLAVALLVVLGQTRIWMWLLAWSLGAAGGLMVAARGLTVVRDHAQAIRRAAQAKIDYRLASSIVAPALANHGTILVLGLSAGAGSLGALRGAQLLYGPVAVLAAAVPMLAASIASWGHEALRTSLHALAGFALLIVTCQAVILVLPTSAGRLILGDTWITARNVSAPYAVFLLALVASLLLSTTLKRLDLRSVPIGGSVSLIAIPLAALGQAMGGISWGLLLATLGVLAGSLLHFIRLRRAVAELSSSNGPSFVQAVRIANDPSGT
jgi:hypothetical protein